MNLQEYEDKIKYENEYFCRMIKEITTNYNYKEARKYKKHHKIQKNSIIFLRN